MDNNYGYNNYNGYDNRPQGNKGMAIASLIMGIISIFLGYFTGFFGVMLGLAAILLGAFSKGKNQARPGTSIGGIITGAIGFVIGLIMIIIVIVLMSNPEFVNMYKELLEFYNK